MYVEISLGVLDPCGNEALYRDAAAVSYWLNTEQSGDPFHLPPLITLRFVSIILLATYSTLLCYPRRQIYIDKNSQKNDRV